MKWREKSALMKNWIALVQTIKGENRTIKNLYFVCTLFLGFNTLFAFSWLRQPPTRLPLHRMFIKSSTIENKNCLRWINKHKFIAFHVRPAIVIETSIFLCHDETNLSKRKPKCFIANSFLSTSNKERLQEHHHHLHTFSGYFYELR